MDTMQIGGWVDKFDRVAYAQAVNPPAALSESHALQ
jgi:hypothetical protein